MIWYHSHLWRKRRTVNGWSQFSGGSRIFPRGCANSQKYYYFSIFCRKLHENERIWTPRGGRASLAPPLGSANVNFIGAWWLGFLVIGITALIGLLPLFFFPEHMAEYYSRVDTQPKKNEPTKENTLMSTIKGKTYYSEWNLKKDKEFFLLCPFKRLLNKPTECV